MILFANSKYLNKMDLFDLTLALTPRIGNKTIKKLIDAFKSAENLFAQSLDQITAKTKLPETIALSIVRRVALNDAKSQIEHCAKHNIRIIALSDPEYPTALKNIHDAPYIIYVQGNVEILSQNTISFVGTRKISPYGERCCNTLIEQIKNTIKSPVIVSGLAFGIDAAAHRAALEFGLPTVAVVPTPLPSVTPAQHTRLAKKILECGGALISEIKANTSTNRRGFIARNRIIAGLSQATIIVESAMEGGSMTTAEIARSEGRVVGAVPGRISDQYSEGCNNLIARQFAFSMTSAFDLIRELNWSDRMIKEEETMTASQIEGISEDEIKVLRCFEQNEAYHISQIEAASGLPVSQLTALLMMLELDGRVRMLAGSNYERLIKL